MDIYFVRHGETGANTQRVYQSPQEGLSDRGARQVAQLVRTIQDINPTHLYTSHYTRARETAHYLGYATDLEPSWLELVSELRYPKAMLSRRHYSLSTFIYGLRWFFDSDAVDILPGAENRREFFARLKDTQQFLAENHAADDRVVIVSHSFFITGFVLHLCRTKPMSLWQVLPYVFRVMRVRNASITHITYDPAAANAPRCAWQVVQYNQTDHLTPLLSATGAEV